MAVWKSKKLHGRFHRALVGPDVVTASSLSWLQLGEKLSKHLDLAHEITATWDVNATIIVPIVVSVNGLIAKSLDQHLKKLSFTCRFRNRIQKAVLLETARIVRRFLSLEP